MPDSSSNTDTPRTLLVTGKLAAPAMHRMADELTERFGARVEVVVLNIQVAALMTAEWVARKLELPRGKAFDRAILPGYLKGDINLIAESIGIPVELGPADLYDLPERFGGTSRKAESYGKFDIEIIAEINHAPRLTMQQIIDLAEAYVRDKADVIDIGCDPQADRPAWEGVTQAVRELRARGMRVSIDSFHPAEVEAACKAGAELVLSVNASNRDAAKAWGAEVVVVPDEAKSLGGLDESISVLAGANVPLRIDPIIEPIGFGFAASLGRYLDVRRRYPDAEMMMGVGNLTEMTEVDSAGVNAMLVGFCQEQRIRSVLTTQVINWSRSCVREIDIARRLMHFAVTHQTVPKHLDPRLVMLRDERLRGMTQAELDELAASLTDRNVRIFAELGRLFAMHKDAYASGDDPFPLFDALGVTDPGHAFYLGYEMAKAVTALTLGKQYVQDEPLDWGLHTRDEAPHYDRRKGSTGD